MTSTQIDILNILFTIGPRTHRNLVHAAKSFEVHTTDSGIRTRTNELVKQGLVESVGKVKIPESPRPINVWALTPRGVETVLFGG